MNTNRLLPSKNTWAFAMAGSALVHAALVFGFWLGGDSDSQRAVIEVEWVEAATRSSQALTPARVIAQPRIPSSRPLAVPRSESDVAVEGKKDPVSESASATTSETETGTRTETGTASAAEVSAQSRYLNDLRRLLEEKKEYPIAARRMGHHGRVKVRFVVDRDGRIHEATIVESSRSEILNRAARSLIEGLSGLKPIPQEIARNQWAVVVPIDYQL